MDINTLIQTIAINAIPLLFAITLHEAAHGYAALKLGDKTAAMMGRLSLNPIHHIDPIGTFLIPLMLFIATSGSMLFGYAKPVPVRFGQLRHPKRDMALVALAGPAANLLMALIWGIAFYLLQALSVSEPFFLQMCEGGKLINVVLFALNLFPIPPLDGGRILVGLLPSKQAIWLAGLERWGFFIVMGLALTKILGLIWMEPVVSVTLSILNALLTPLQILIY